MTVRRPIGTWSQRIVETGLVLVPAEADGADDTVVMYALLEGDNVVMLETAAGGHTKLAAVPDRVKTILWGRYPDRKLAFPANPMGTLWRTRPTLPLQDVDPQRINQVYTGDDLEGLTRRRGQARSGEWDTQVSPFADPASFSNAAAEADALYQSIKTRGYLRQSELGGSDDDEILAAIGRDGRYILLSGAKRLAIARRLGLASVPVNVTVRHNKWEASRQRVLVYAGRHEGRVYQRVLHPDLVDLQAHHDEDRLPILKRAFEGYNPAGKKLVDIGAHWGQMSAAMEKLGFTVTAVEANTQSAKFTRMLRDAMENKFEVWEGSVFEFPHIGEQNVVLALNIFHHFLKAQETYDGLVSMLKRTNADMIVFAAHVYERKGPDFQNAYRNYPPEEFARFVSEHSRLPKIELMGKSHDGRSLYRLTRA